MVLRLKMIKNEQDVSAQTEAVNIDRKNKILTIKKSNITLGSLNGAHIKLKTIKQETVFGIFEKKLFKKWTIYNTQKESFISLKKQRSNDPEIKLTRNNGCVELGKGNVITIGKIKFEVL